MQKHIPSYKRPIEASPNVYQRKCPPTVYIPPSNHTSPAVSSKPMQPVLQDPDNCYQPMEELVRPPHFQSAEKLSQPPLFQGTEKLTSPHHFQGSIPQTNGISVSNCENINSKYSGPPESCRQQVTHEPNRTTMYKQHNTHGDGSYISTNEYNTQAYRITNEYNTQSSRIANEYNTQLSHITNEYNIPRLQIGNECGTHSGSHISKEYDIHGSQISNQYNIHSSKSPQDYDSHGAQSSNKISQSPEYYNTQNTQSPNQFNMNRSQNLELYHTQGPQFSNKIVSDARPTEYSQHPYDDWKTKCDEKYIQDINQSYRPSRNTGIDQSMKNLMEYVPHRQCTSINNSVNIGDYQHNDMYSTNYQDNDSKEMSQSTPFNHSRNIIDTASMHKNQPTQSKSTSSRVTPFAKEIHLNDVFLDRRKDPHFFEWKMQSGSTWRHLDESDRIEQEYNSRKDKVNLKDKAIDFETMTWCQKGKLFSFNSANPVKRVGIIWQNRANGRVYRYDSRIAQLLEKAYKSSIPTLKISINGQGYRFEMLDHSSMKQINQKDFTKVRHIVRREIE